MALLSRYTLIQPIHEGRSTTLYRGRRSADGVPIVAKVLKSEYPEPRDIAKLRHEFAILRQLALPGVVLAHAMEKHHHGVALVLEDTGGQSLAQVLAARRLDPVTVLRITVSLADTLGAVHERNVIHKDIKPHNILVQMDGQLSVKLADFGIATRLSQETQRAQAPDALEGTLLYMAPEQTGRMNRVVDRRTDLYSFGATLYELLTGTPPFPLTDPLELVHSHIARTPPSPRALAPEVPEALSDIVMKLLSKAAEDRYQSARGLKHDLSACLARLESTGRAAPFPLGQQDASGELRLPQKLYGRDAELSTLVSAALRTASGASELLLIAGHAGVGKSALVGELPRVLTRERRSFLLAAGKFEELSRGTPYVGVARVLQDIVRQILAEPAEAVARGRAALLRAVGQSGQVLVELVPELQLLLGPQPPVPELGPTEAQNRFALVFQRFFRALTAERPLCLFLDDLQWADPASLKLLPLLLSDQASGLSERATGHLLVVGAYRAGEVDAAHPLATMVEALSKAGGCVRTLDLAPLSAADVTRFVADALACGEERAAPLARLVFERTGGNPFFLSQLLLALHEEGSLAFDGREGAFSWELDRIRERGLTGDVVALMASKIERLAPGTRRVLELAACVGHEFTLKMLATLHGRSPVETGRDLWEALREGLVLPKDPEYRLLYDDSTAASFDVSYRFLHDRIHEAAYALTEGDLRDETHLRIGRLLLARGDRDIDEDHLFGALRHLNLVAARLDAPHERQLLASWNLRAGRKAKAATAYQAAAAYLRAGIAALGGASWEAQPDLAFALRLEQAECEYLAGAHDASERLFEELLRRAATRVERARVLRLRAILYLTSSRFTDAVSAGIAALALFNIDVPKGDDALGAAFAAGLAEVSQSLAGRSVDALASAPEMTDPDARAACEVLSTLLQPGPLIGPVLYGFLNVTQINLLLTHGHCDLSAYGAMSFGFMLSLVLERHDDARTFSDLALVLQERFRNDGLACKLNELVGVCSHFFKPVRESLAHLDRAYHAGLESGDFLYLSYAFFHGVAIRFCAGDELGAVRADAGRGIELMQRTQVAICAAGLSLVKQAAASLAGATDGRLSLSGGGFDEAAFVEAHRGPDAEFIACTYYLLKAQLAFLHEEHAVASSMAVEAEARSASGNNLYLLTELSFYACLTLLAEGPPPAGGDARGARAEMLARHRAKLAAWAERCPENFQHKHALVCAEAARASGEGLDAALPLYDEAIEASRQNGFAHHAALASELCARFLLARGRSMLARVYMTDAYYGYLQWGATAKAAQLAERHAHLLLQGDASARFVPSATVSSSSSSTGGLGFDALSVLRAARAISGELLLDRLLERLVEILVESTGAQRGVLLLEQEGALRVEAVIGVDPDERAVGSAAAARVGDALAMSVVRHVQRTREPVIAGYAAAGQQFAGDPYIAARRPRSVLCLALAHQGRLTGVLYLENRVLHDAFSPARLELLRALASQAASAIENAQLYARVEAMRQELHRANASLANEVAQQTEQLRGANERLTRELAERERSERERAALQEELLRAHRARLLELSSPIIPITDRIVVMPLIGQMDADRAEQTLATALEGAQANQAEVVIIDITGLKGVDAGVAGTLIRTAGALRLLGTRVVLTGVRAEVAQALVALDIDLGGIVTMGTLRSGIAHAFRRSSGGLSSSREP
ncbi:protein kinase domain-containing protein [Sorangium sp. So ce1389]|uniref:protein kinase domain-containing protein n=1 Tax=Sorangium sp. So ce1389 TaxID=3133336 RepID=UPI003F64808A